MTFDYVFGIYYIPWDSKPRVCLASFQNENFYSADTANHSHALSPHDTKGWHLSAVYIQYVSGILYRSPNLVWSPSWQDVIALELSGAWEFKNCQIVRLNRPSPSHLRSNEMIVCALKPARRTGRDVLEMNLGDHPLPLVALLPLLHLSPAQHDPDSLWVVSKHLVDIWWRFGIAKIRRFKNVTSNHMNLSKRWIVGYKVNWYQIYSGSQLYERNMISSWHLSAFRVLYSHTYSMVSNTGPHKKWSSSYVSHSVTIRYSIGVHHIDLIDRSRKSHLPNGRTAQHILPGYVLDSWRGSEWSKSPPKCLLASVATSEFDHHWTKSIEARFYHSPLFYVHCRWYLEFLPPCVRTRSNRPWISFTKTSPVATNVGSSTN